MAAKAIVVLGPSGLPLANCIGRLDGVDSPLTNATDGYALFPKFFSAGDYSLIVFANGFKTYIQPVSLSDRNQNLIVGGNSTDPMNINLPPLSFNHPSLDVIRHVKGNFGGIIVPELQFGFSNKVLFTPGYVVESAKVRMIIRKRYLDAGFSHFPINTYNDTPIYHNYYPQWDDSLINQYLEELLDDNIIPMCSLFPDNVKTLKGNVSSDLVLSGFVGWENPSPIIRPALDNDNLFYVAKQAYPRSLIYWHNPSYQGAPYVDAKDWGRNTGDEVNDRVWQYMINQSGCQGLLNQGNAWQNDSQDSINRLSDFHERLILGRDNWPIADVVDFEQTVYYLTTEQGNPEQALTWAQKVRNSCDGLMGYCNG
jgi:hypothetical protein